jgi:hypothetical protein
LKDIIRDSEMNLVASSGNFLARIIYYTSPLNGTNSFTNSFFLGNLELQCSEAAMVYKIMQLG